MEREQLYQLIDLQPEIVERLHKTGKEMDLKQAEPWLEGMLEGERAARSYDGLKELLGEDADQIKMLYCQLECARRAYDGYREKQIEESIYRDTMKCFPRFLGECRRRNGRMYFDRGWWTWRQISMRLFRIGALEYEFAEHEGGNAIAIHIPSDADLSWEAVEDSLKQAGLFFQAYYPEYEYEKYTCDSWLLSPALQPFLASDSHILSFRNRFTILREENESRDYMEWLFRVPADTAYEKLPEETSLQRQVKELLLQGRNTGTAYGMMEAGAGASRPGT